MGYRIQYACISHPGRVHKLNQDNFICDGKYMPPDDTDTVFPLSGVCSGADKPLFGVFDGMGGEQCGEAAALIAATRASELEGGSIKALSRFCTEANREICAFSSKNGIRSMGSTAAVVSFDKNKLYLCNIGDSKIFRFSGGKAQQLSEDHLCIAPFGVKPPLSQHLGIPETEMRIEPYFLKGECSDGEVYLICSDGLTDMTAKDESLKEEIAKIIDSAPVSIAALQLLDLGLEKDGRDNITLILCKIEKESQGLFRKKQM